MRYTRRIVAGCYIFISVLFLSGCSHMFWDKGEHRCAVRQAEQGSTGPHEKNCEEYH